MCYAGVVKRRVEFATAALKALSSMPKTYRKFVLDGIQTHLSDNDASEVSRNKFPLKRPSPYADRELRLDNWRVFYTVLGGDLVLVNMIGEKRGNKLFVQGEEFAL